MAAQEDCQKVIDGLPDPLTENEYKIIEAALAFGADYVDDDATVLQMTNRQLVAFTAAIARATLVQAGVLAP